MMDIVVPSFRLGQSGGIERYTWHACDELARRGHHVTIYAPAQFAGSRPPSTVFRATGKGRAPTGLSGLLDLLTFGPIGTSKILARQRSAIRYGPVPSLV